jgi:hypothetical protein
MTLKLYSKAGRSVEKEGGLNHREGCVEALMQPDGSLVSGRGGGMAVAEKADSLAYLADLVGELRDMARTSGLQSLGWFLSLAHQQAMDDYAAAKQAQQVKPGAG